MDTCSQLTFFVVENQRHGGQLTYQWLLREAASLGLSGGSAFRAVAGYGRHHLLHEARFYELAGELPMEVIFVVAPGDAQRLIEHVAASGLSLRYYVLPAQSGTTGEV
jgi:PII-like signaling protein